MTSHSLTGEMVAWAPCGVYVVVNPSPRVVVRGPYHDPDLMDMTTAWATHVMQVIVLCMQVIGKAANVLVDGEP